MKNTAQGDFERNWNKIVKDADGLENLNKAPTEGSWGILYESGNQLQKEKRVNASRV